MRCDNCGWNNPEGLTNCQKCNQNLVPPVSVAPAPAAISSNAINQTIVSPARQAVAPQPSSDVSCPRCGYPMATESSFCPNCGTPVGRNAQQSQKTIRVLPEEFLGQTQASAEPVLKATVREIPVEMMDSSRNSRTVRVLPEEMIVENEPEITPEPSFKLVPMDNFDGGVTSVKEFTGASAVVGRDSLVEADAYMPEGVSVEFSCEDGQWSVVDKGDTKSVFVSASHPVRLQSGDVIVIANRRFIFE